MTPSKRSFWPLLTSIYWSYHFWKRYILPTNGTIIIRICLWLFFSYSVKRNFSMAMFMITLSRMSIGIGKCFTVWKNEDFTLTWKKFVKATCFSIIELISRNFSKKITCTNKSLQFSHRIVENREILFWTEKYFVKSTFLVLLKMFSRKFCQKSVRGAIVSFLCHSDFTWNQFW